MMKNTVLGMTGKNAPMNPSATKKNPAPIQNHRIGLDGMGSRL
jgi:hypothetical protein